MELVSFFSVHPLYSSSTYPFEMLGLGWVVYSPSEVFTLSANLVWKEPSWLRRIMLITEGSLEPLVNLMVLGVEKSHTVFDDGVVTVMAKADERRLRAVIVNEYRILIEWNYWIIGECAGGSISYCSLGKRLYICRWWMDWGLDSWKIYIQK